MLMIKIKVTLHIFLEPKWLKNSAYSILSKDFEVSKSNTKQSVLFITTVKFHSYS